MARQTETAEGYDHEPIRDAELNDVRKTRAAEIAGNLGVSEVSAISYHEDRDEYTVKLEVDGGFVAFGAADSKYGIKAVTGKGRPDTISLHVVRKRI